jgi:hypothetical protein
MKTLATSLCFGALLLSGAAEAQTKSTPRPAGKAGNATARVTTARPAAKQATPLKAAPVAQVAPAAPAPEAKTVVAVAPKAATANAGFGKGSMAVNLGIGLGLGYGYLGNANLPALNLSVERGIIDNIGPGTISVGGLVGYKAYRYNYPGTDYKATWTDIYVAARGLYHYNLTENPKVDTYAGISLGLRLESWKDTYYGDDYNSSYGGAYAHSGIFVGGRYYFSDKVGAFAEAGYDMSYLKLGLTAKF